MVNENKYKSSLRKITHLTYLMFLILVLFSILDEVFDLPHVIFNSPKTPINRHEIIIEVSFIIIVCIIVVYIIKKLIAIQGKFLWS